MTNYRRVRVPGATYFFTVNLADRSSDLLVRCIDDLRAAYAATIREVPVQCDALVVLPNHLHAVWTLPQGDADFSERWRRIKARFSRRIGQHFPRSASKQAKRETGLWQRRFWEHRIRDATDYRTHVAYCWGNPVRHRLVERPKDWVHSLIHRDIRQGRVDPAWCGGLGNGDFGE